MSKQVWDTAALLLQSELLSRRLARDPDLFSLECSSFPFFTPKILVIRVLKSRVEEFLT